MGDKKEKPEDKKLTDLTVGDLKPIAIAAIITFLVMVGIFVLLTLMT